uniref:NR LBD domain-containing protein n=1 Tax=Panagrolaimus superbus TaxID=310955 RepID=A0A914Y6P2_9BILA
MLERLAQLENNFSLLLSRGKIEPYASLGEALGAPSRFTQPINVKITDPIATPEENKEQCQMPFWRSRIIALYIDWAKTFFAFRKLPYADQKFGHTVALITNHASSYMIMCEAFRTPEHKKDVSPPPNFRTIIKQEVIDDEMDATTSTPNLNNVIQQQPSPPPLPPTSSTGTTLQRLKTPPPTATSHSSYFPSNMHTFFDPDLIREGKSCIETGVRSLVDVPPAVHYPTVGSLSGLTPVMAVMIDYVMKPFRRLKITTTEFATLQAIMFFDPGKIKQVFKAAFLNIFNYL